MFSLPPSFWRDRLQACGMHLGLSVAVAAVAALLVFGVWYPYPYREISGGSELFFLLVAVDVVLGPLITLAVFNRAKPWSELRRDLMVVILLQSAALGYGLWTVFIARPVHMVFEYDRFSVVHAIDVPLELLARAPQGIEPLPITGPTLLALRPFKSNQEKIDATLAALQGGSLSARPDLWESYNAALPEILAAARPVAELKTRFPQHAVAIDAVLSPQGARAAGLRYLPLTGRKSYWTVFLDPDTAQVLHFMPLDSF
jgi:hypothetical protein